MYDQELLQSKLLENSVSLLNDFFYVLSDGYNPTRIELKCDLTKNINEADQFLFASYTRIGSFTFFQDTILPTKTQVDTIEQRIMDNFRWSLAHLSGNTQAPQLFESPFHRDNLLAIIKKIETGLTNLIQPWKGKSNEYLIDTKDGSERRVLFIHGDNKSICLEFANYIY